MKPKQIALWSLIVAIIGVLVAVISLYSGHDVPSSASSSVKQNSTVLAPQPDCSALGTQGGNVTLNCDRSVHVESPPSPKPFPSFIDALDSETIEKFEKFIDANSNKVVRLDLRINTIDTPVPYLSWYTDKELAGAVGLEYYYTSDCPKGIADCKDWGGTIYKFSDAKDASPAYYNCNGDYCINGYYVVGPQQGMLQGYVTVNLERVPDADAALRQ